jgi:hypothetical protein
MYTTRKSSDLFYENYRGFVLKGCNLYLKMLQNDKKVGVGPIISILYDTVYYILFITTAPKLIPSKAGINSDG